MGAFIAKQPNGLYCRFSTIVDTVTHWNMTKEDYLNNYTGTVRDREVAQDTLDNYLQPFDEVLERFVPNNMTIEEFEELVVKMSI